MPDCANTLSVSAMTALMSAAGGCCVQPMQVHARLARDNFGDGSFAGAGRAEENHIGKVLLSAHAAQHAAFADKGCAWPTTSSKL